MEPKEEIGQAIAKEISHTIAKKIAIGIAFFFAFLFFIAFGGVAVLLLWNWLVPGIFNLRPLTFWEALGLLALCRILFGGFGRGSHGHHERRAEHKRWWKTSRAACETAAVPATPTTAAPTVGIESREATNNG